MAKAYTKASLLTLLKDRPPVFGRESSVDAMRVTPVEVYDKTRLPHYGAIDYDSGSETVALPDESLQAYIRACTKFAATAEEDGYLDDSRRVDFSAEVDAFMTVEATGEHYWRGDMQLCPGEIRWAGMPKVCEEVLR